MTLKVSLALGSKMLRLAPMSFPKPTTPITSNDSLCNAAWQAPPPQPNLSRVGCLFCKLITTWEAQRRAQGCIPCCSASATCSQAGVVVRDMRCARLRHVGDVDDLARPLGLDAVDQAVDDSHHLWVVVPGQHQHTEHYFMRACSCTAQQGRHKSRAQAACRGSEWHLRLRGMKAGATPLRTAFHSGWAVCSEKRPLSTWPCRVMHSYAERMFNCTRGQHAG
jgi:hypothetical protein